MTDGNGCASNVVTVVIAAAPSLVVATANPSSPTLACNGDTVDVVVTGSGGTGSYTGDGTFSLGAGSHVFSVTDGNGCASNVVTVVIAAPPQLTISAGLDPVQNPAILCNGGWTGVRLTASGGSGPYSYTFGTRTPFLTYASPFTVSNVPAGSFAFSVRDGNGCQASSTVNIVVSEPHDTPAHCAANGMMFCPSSCSCKFR